MSSAEHPNAGRIRRLFQAFRNRDLAAIQAAIPEHAVWHFPGRKGALAGSHRGRAAILAFLGKVTALTGGSFHFELEDVIANDASAVAIFRGGGQREGRTLDNPTCLRMRIQDSEIVELWEFVWDLYAVDEFLGVEMRAPSDPNANLPSPPARLVDRLRNDDFVIASVDAAGGGFMGAKKLRLVFRKDEFTIDVKWKAAPAGGDGWNNSPRREIGAYAVQQLFLDPDDHPVPPVVARGIPLDAYAVVDEDATPNIEGTRCVFGAMAAWLENVVQPERAFDPERFSADRRYAFHFANLNLLAYLIAHRDARSNNFLMPTDPSQPRVFSIDNGIAFGGVLYNFFTWHFDEIRTGGLPRPSIDRLRRVSREKLSGLGVLGELRADFSGVLRAVTPGENLDPAVGTRAAPGRIQFGLTAQEIDAIATRLQELLARIDAGELGVF